MIKRYCDKCGDFMEDLCYSPKHNIMFHLSMTFFSGSSQVRLELCPTCEDKLYEFLGKPEDRYKNQSNRGARLR